MRKFIEDMKKKGLVTEINDAVSSEYEAPKLSLKRPGMLLFNDLDGKNGVMNLLSTREALSVALSVPVSDLVSHLSKCKYNGRIVEDGTISCERVDLDKIPIMRHYPKDAGRYITAGVVFSAYGGVENASVHRMLVSGKDKLVARLVEGRHTHTLLKQAQKNGEKLPVAIAIGLNPLVMFASCSRVPQNMELAFAAELLGGEIKVKRLSNGIRVPDAEIILEGYIGTEMAEEGPFVDITGTYDPIRQQSVIELTGMHLKENFIYHGILPAGDEHKLLMGAPYEPLIYKSVSGVTGVRDVILTKGGCGYLHAVVKIAKRTNGDGKNAIMAAFAAHTSLKHVIIVDEDIDITNSDDIEFALATRVRADTDIMIISGVRGSSLDPCRISDGMNVKMGIDATMELGRTDEYIRATWE